MSEQQTPSHGTRFPAGMLAPRGNRAVVENVLKEMSPTAFDAEAPEQMLAYPARGPVDASSLNWLGPAGAMGGEVLSGDPRLYGRFDFRSGNLAAGVFMATTGLIRVTFPFTEHATILEGEVTLTDETGKTYCFKPGDSYFIRQNQVILWEVKGKRVIKSFFNVTTM